MSFTYSRNILVFFLVFTLMIFSAVNVSAECLVRADQCEESSTATDIQTCQNDANCEVISGSCFDNNGDYIQACQIGCCCNTNTKTYDTINGGLCKSPNIFSVNDYNANTCTSWCSGTTGKSYTVSGTIKYTSNGVTTNVDGATVTLGSRTYTTNANGVYTFSNVVESSTQYTLTASKNTIPCSGTINFNANDQSVTTQP
ncbi:MAG TPA: carboxypeptidase-like regulatory domain-containing protein, partial [Allocoleopsis sp.]